ncbi:MAG: NifB/NifX family molybdenum-iron cluster-binding protein [Syntrophales bacterium]|nr:NifB/NifX family molybdenum-iron cluster-binding protein [Syntrophales bacterium]
MKVCFPVLTDNGIDSVVYNHFGSAPAFVIIDTDEEQAATVDNRDLHHVHGACNPIMALGGNRIDAVVVGGIGAGALTKLNADGIRVYRSVEATVKGNLDLLRDDRLPELMMQHTCAGHQGGCAHH